MQKRGLSAAECSALCSSLAELELCRMRQLAVTLPSCKDFEQHCEIGFELGISTRRLQYLLEGADENFANIAPSPPIAWNRIWWSSKESPQIAGKDQYRVVSKAVHAALAETGLAGHRYRLAVEACLREKSRAAASVRCPVPARRSLPILLRLHRGQIARVKNQALRARRASFYQSYDPRWQIMPFGRRIPRMRSIETRVGLLHKLHHTALRETVAEEVAALNLFEYDGLPWAFYIDMGQQAEDEARHALLASAMLMSMGGRLGQFALSHFGNFYQLFWEMSLDERLVAMNLDTEAVSRSHLERAERRVRKAGYPKVAWLYGHIARDEMRHARIGARWFVHLYPNKSDRGRAIAAARALVVVHLASAQSFITGESTSELLASWSSGSAPLSFSEPLGARHESEVSLLTARSKSLSEIA